MIFRKENEFTGFSRALAFICIALQLLVISPRAIAHPYPEVPEELNKGFFKSVSRSSTPGKALLMGAAGILLARKSMALGRITSTSMRVRALDVAPLSKISSLPIDLSPRSALLSSTIVRPLPQQAGRASFISTSFQLNRLFHTTPVVFKGERPESLVIKDAQASMGSSGGNSEDWVEHEFVKCKYTQHPDLADMPKPDLNGNIFIKLPVISGVAESGQLARAGSIKMPTKSSSTELVLGRLIPNLDGREPINNPSQSMHRVHAQLNIRFGNEFYGGSGTMVGPRHLITAAHNLYDRKTHKYADRIEVRLSLAGNIFPYDQQIVTKAFTYKKYIEAPFDSEATTYDLALFVLDEAIGNRTDWYGLSYLSDRSSLLLGEFNITGYPGYVGKRYETLSTKYPDDETGAQEGRVTPFSKMWTMSNKDEKDKIVPLKFSPERVYYEIDTSGGQSGSGIWYGQNNEHYVVGVHAYGEGPSGRGNFGVRITQSKLEDILKWVSSTYTVQQVGASITPLLQTSAKLVSSKQASDEQSGSGHSSGSSTSQKQENWQQWAKERVKQFLKDHWGKITGAVSAVGVYILAALDTEIKAELKKWWSSFLHPPEQQPIELSIDTTTAYVPSRVLVNGQEKDAFEAADAIMKTHQVIVLIGDSGVGKSRFVQEYYHRHKETMKEGRVMRADSLSDLATAYRSLARRLKADGLIKADIEKERDEDIKMLVEDSFKSSTKEWLLIFDNVGNFSALEKYLSNLPGNVKVILTKPNTKDYKKNKKSQIFELLPFNQEQIRKYIEETLKEELSEKGLRKLADGLYRENVCLPQELEQAIHFFKEEHSEIDKFLNDIKINGGTIFKPLIKRVIKKSLAGWKFLQYSAHLDPDFIPDKLSEKIIEEITLQFIREAFSDPEMYISPWSFQRNVFSWRRISEILENLSLVKRVRNAEDLPGIRIHRRVQERTLNYPKKNIPDDEASIKLVEIISVLFPEVDEEAGPKWKVAELYVPHSLRLLKTKTPEDLIEKAHLYTKVGLYYEYLYSNYNTSLEFYNDANQIYKNKDDQENIAKTDAYLGWTYIKTKNHSKSTEHLEAALSYYKRQLVFAKVKSQVLSNIATCLTYIAENFEATKDYDEVFFPLSTALGIYLSLASNKTKTEILSNSMISSNIVPNQYKKNEKHEISFDQPQEAPKVEEGKFFDFQIAKSLGSLAKVFAKKNNNDVATACNAQSRKIFERLGKQANVAETLKLDGEIYLAQRNKKQALDFFTQVYAIDFKVLGKNHIHTEEVKKEILLIDPNFDFAALEAEATKPEL